MKILMVCLGNICRSPLAHGIFEHLAKSQNRHWTIDSAGTGDWHIGQEPDRRSIAVARQNGIDITNQRAQQFRRDFFDEYDHILVMDRQNYKDVLRLAKDDAQKAKIRLFLNDDIVPDPYHDDQQFEPVFQLIYKRSQELIEEFSKA